MHAIQTLGLTYSYSKDEPVLNNINLEVPEGSIFGFLGPNGAGKTTTIRLLLGLLTSPRGTIKIFDMPLSEQRIEILRKTGSLIESPSLYGHLTAWENLSVLQKIHQCSKARMCEVLEIVGLLGAAKKTAGKFSLGMKQRLGIACALLHSPSLLILDEPTNGLDPNGIIDIRELLKKLNRDHNMTILLSSHLLSEIEKMVTHLGIINKGALLFHGTLAQLHSKQTQTSVTTFSTSDPEKSMEILAANNLHPVLVNGNVNVSVADKETLSRLSQQLLSRQIDIYQITTQKNDLEAIFIDMVKS